MSREYRGTEIDGEYLYIGSGGVGFRVLEDDKGRCLLVIEATHYGQRTNEIDLLTTPDSLRKIGEAFIRASQHEFPGTPYCYAAVVMEPSSGGDAEGSEVSVGKSEPAGGIG